MSGSSNSESKRVLVTGGAGYVGSVLVPRLLGAGYEVTVLDAFYFGGEGLSACRGDPRLRVVEADIRDHGRLAEVLSRGAFDAVIHLAALANDPCSELDPDLTHEVNLLATQWLMTRAKEAGVGRFLYASSASVYGVKEEEEVTEDLPLEPLTIYARTKAEGEAMLGELVDDGFCGVSVRAATVCGMSPRLRLDLTLNILTAHAVLHGEIRVFGGGQMRPNVHVADLADFYALLLEADPDLVAGQAFNVCAGNATVLELAEMVRREAAPAARIRVEPTPDPRSYRLCARKAEAVLGYRPRRRLEDAVRELGAALRQGRVPEPDSPRYRNIEHMKRILPALRLAASTP